MCLRQDGPSKLISLHLQTGLLYLPLLHAGLTFTGYLAKQNSGKKMFLLIMYNTV